MTMFCWFLPYNSVNQPCVMYVYEVSQSCPTLCNPMDCSPPGFCPWNFPGKNTGVDCHSLLQRNFPTQGLNPGLLHRRQILYCLSSRDHWGNPSFIFMWGTRHDARSGRVRSQGRGDSQGITDTILSGGTAFSAAEGARLP